MKLKLIMLLSFMLLLIPFSYAFQINIGEVLFNESFDYNDDYENHGWSYYESDGSFPNTPISSFGIFNNYSLGENRTSTAGTDVLSFIKNTSLFTNLADNNNVIISYNLSLQNVPTTQSSNHFRIILLKANGINVGFDIQHFPISGTKGYTKVLNSFTGGENCIINTNFTIPFTHEVILEMNFESGEYSIYHDNNAYGCEDKLLGTTPETITGIEIQTRFLRAGYLKHYLDDIRIIKGNLSEVPSDCPYPLLFCDDFDYTTSLYSTKDWLVQLGGGEIDRFFAPINNQLDLTTDNFISPYHTIPAWEIEYRLDEDRITADTQYAPVMSSEFDLNITESEDGFKYSAFDSGYARPVYSVKAELGSPSYFYRFEEGSGNVVIDEMGNQNGIIVNNAPYVSSKGDRGTGTYALNFNGTNQYVNLSNIADFERNDTFSVSLWFNASETGGLIGKMLGAGTFQGWYIDVNANGFIDIYLMNSLGGDNYILVRESTDYIDKTWYNLIMTYDGSSTASGVKLYIDGILKSPSIQKDTLTATIKNSVNTQISGRNGSNNIFNGSIDEVAIFYDVLTQTAVTDIYNNGVQYTYNNSWFYLDSDNTWNIICSECVSYNKNYKIKISSFFSNKSLYPFISNIQESYINFYIDGVQQGDSFPFIDSMAVNVYEHYIVKSDFDKFIIDNYYVMSGQDKYIDTTPSYYIEQYIRPNIIDTSIPAEETDFVDDIDTLAGLMGFFSTTSKLLLVLLIMIVVGIASNTTYKSTVLTIFLEILVMIGAIYIGWFPLWLVFMLFIIGMFLTYLFVTKVLHNEGG